MNSESEPKSKMSEESRLTALDEIRHFLYQVHEMRARQQAYYACSHNSKKPSLLSKAKAQERIIDKRINRMRNLTENLINAADHD